jgi:predicted GIY-YIG superfamily endonuclease
MKGMRGIIPELPYVVYRAYGEGDTLLYVGATKVLMRRLSGHRLRASWWPAMRRVVIERYATADEAGDREFAIYEEHRPPGNASYCLRYCDSGYGPRVPEPRPLPAYSEEVS